MTLADAKVGDELKVIGRVNGRSGAGSDEPETHGGHVCGCGRRVRDNLAALGVHVGDRVRVMRSAPFHGPVLVKVPSSGIFVAVGRGMAEKVEVEPVDAGA
ncbi:MAG: ferrous iron transport protein A [Deltaproteobacteria bacterium]|nr:ferrous iron transport protein A [Deltaproteobacteria bacterium]